MQDHLGIVGFIILAIDVWAIVSVINSNRGTGAKVLWILLVLVLPVFGALIWLLVGPRASQ